MLSFFAWLASLRFAETEMEREEKIGRALQPKLSAQCAKARTSCAFAEVIHPRFSPNACVSLAWVPPLLLRD